MIGATRFSTVQFLSAVLFSVSKPLFLQMYDDYETFCILDKITVSSNVFLLSLKFVVSQVGILYQSWADPQLWRWLNNVADQIMRLIGNDDKIEATCSLCAAVPPYHLHITLIELLSQVSSPPLF